MEVCKNCVAVNKRNPSVTACGSLWMQNAVVSKNGKRNMTTVTPERPCVPRLLLRLHLTHLNSASPCVPFERQCARGRREAG